MDIGFVGLGRMGSGMAANLARAGHRLSVYNRSPGKAKPLLDLGAAECARIADVCGGDVVITMLADDDAVESVVFAEEGVLRSLPRNALHISSSTISVALSARLTKSHAEAGQQYVAAPVFGRPEAAFSQKLFVVAGGASEAVARCAPLFDAIGQKTFVVSEKPESANLVKLSGNFLVAAVIEMLGEALALVHKGGIDRRDYLNLITSALFDTPVYKVYGGLIVEKAFTPAGFAVPLGQKDIRLILAAAEDLHVPMPVAGLLRDRFLALLAQGGETLDWSAIGALAAKDAGC